MRFALVDNERTEARKGIKGTCQACGFQVTPVCGPIIIHHWRHDSNCNCDPWWENETKWHRNWKNNFPKDWQEKVCCDDQTGKWHFADVRTDKGVVIEFQNSPISKELIKEREQFYGEQMVWVINGIIFRDNLTSKEFWEDPETINIRLSHPRIDIWRKKSRNEEFFKWKYPPKSWEGVLRPVFIDLGEDSLLWVKEGMGTKQISGVYILKEKFIDHYSAVLSK
ncbi:competence protein CoiA [Cyclobacterium sp. SYSU L10401]|uniref:competence protein CoiA n=1 Tax=Cyclobacterium sp. SYSU L10401 TaxID=2678657 RepID=UPI0013D7F38F|nr:hypothetical protein [Cyclobacterium sp. SYSU L10401]